jgi:hypothetical protein
VLTAAIYGDGCLGGKLSSGAGESRGDAFARFWKLKMADPGDETHAARVFRRGADFDIRVDADRRIMGYQRVVRLSEKE